MCVIVMWAWCSEIGDHAHTNMMATAVKTPWRTAACLMFLTGPFRYIKQPQKLTKPLAIGHAPFLQYKSPEQSGEQPQLLFVRRHSKSGFMASGTTCTCCHPMVTSRQTCMYMHVPAVIPMVTSRQTCMDMQLHVPAVIPMVTPPPGRYTCVSWRSP